MRKLLTIIWILFVVVTFAQKKPSINKAKVLFDKGKLSEAKAMIDAAAVDEKLSTKAKTWFYRGMIYMVIDTTTGDDGAVEVAVKSFNKALELDPNEKSTTTFTEAGIENVDTKLQSYYGYYYNKAIGFYNGKDYPNAATNFETAYLINPADTTSIVNAAYAYSIAENTEKAKASFAKASEDGVKDKNIFLQLYNYAVKEENLEEALAVIRKGKEAIPGDPDLAKYEINVLIQMEQIEEAKSELLSTIKNEPDNPDLLFTLGVIYEETAEVAKAEETYKKAIAIDAEHYNSNFNLGVLLFNKSQQLIKERNALSYTEKEKLEELSNKIDTYLNGALPVWERLYGLDATNQTVLETLGYIYSNLKMNDKAMKMRDELDAIGGKDG